VTWPDVNTGAAGANDRYRIVRSTSPITSGNYGAATVIASYVPNNSGQLVNGDPANSTDPPYTQSYRQDGTRPMVMLTDVTSGGTQLAPFTGLQVYTALATQNAYYAVIKTDTSDANPVYLGSVGPIAESVGTPKPIKWAASGSRGQSYGNITNPNTNTPVVLRLHQSNATGGCSNINCIYGDYWAYFIPAAHGAYWYDGAQINFDVLQDHGSSNWPGQSNTLVISPRDTVWNSLGTGSMETYHQGLGMSPNPLVGPANRMYRGKTKAYAAILNWAVTNYSADINQLHCDGVSMGAWGSANSCMRMTSPRISAVWMGMPRWRMDNASSGGWAGATWTSSMPFRGTVGTAPSTLGTNASAIQTDDGQQWGGSGGYVDMPTFIAANAGDDLPVAIWMTSKDDSFSLFSDHLSALSSFQSARRGHAFVWFMGQHDTGYPARNVIDCDWTSPNTAQCYHKADFKLNVPYIAFANSSIDDNPGTATRNSAGLMDGDYTGCKNCGFHASVTTDTAGSLVFTVSNSWMGLSPTVFASTTITGSMAASGSGSVGLTSTSGFLTANASGNNYFLIGTGAGAEVVQATWSGTTLNFTGRGLLGTAGRTHNAGDPIVQLTSQPTGPNGGPYSSMTVDMTPRRMQGFIKPNGTVINCTATPFGGSPVGKSGTVTGDSGVFTLTGVPINVGGATSVSCS
jgi:hypothetical protein